jgi:hypothetical protein
MADRKVGYKIFPILYPALAGINIKSPPGLGPGQAEVGYKLHMALASYE